MQIGITMVMISWYILIFAASFLFLTFFLSTVISIMFGDYNIMKNFFDICRSQKEIDAENIERHNILMKLLASKNPGL